MQTIDPIMSPVTNLDQLRVKIPQRNNFTEAGTASPDSHPPTTLPTPPPPPPPLDSAGNKSNNSSCTEMSHPSPITAEGDISPTALDNTSSQQQQPPHHLLKHHLHPENAQALSQFDTDDVKEASREISRMGQRDLQAKFRLVYGTQTHSNNNEWLRRKLYEAIGALPVKTNINKSKGRRHHHHHHQAAVAHQLPKVQQHIITASPSTGPNGGGLTTHGGPEHQLQQHGGSSPRGGKRGGGGLMRSPASTPRKLIAMELKRRMSLVPSSPRMYASSVLEAHRNISDETDSSGDDDDDNGGGDFELDDERQDESTIVGSGDGKDGMAVPRATTTVTTTGGGGGGGHLRSFTRLASQHQQRNNNNNNNNNSSSVVIGTSLAQDAVYYTPSNGPHQALVIGNTGSGAGAAMRRVSRAGLSRLHPTYWQHRQQEQQQAAKPSSKVAVGWMPRSSSTTQLLKSMDLDVLGDREWPDALRFNPHDSFNLASMPDDEEFYDGDEQQQFQMENVNDGGNAAAASAVMDYYCN